MLAFYDLSISPATYDITTFLTVAKGMARDAKQTLHVVFVPGPNGGFKNPTEETVRVKPLSIDEQKFRFDHILLPACRAWGVTYTICVTRSDARAFKSDLVYPVGYDLEDNPTWGHTMSKAISAHREGQSLVWARPSKVALKMVREHYPERPVVITLRETFHECSNSDIENWLKVMEEIEYPLVVVRDTSRATAPLPPYPTAPLASLDLDYRLALYHHAMVNLTTTGGPPALCWYSDLPYISCRMHSEDRRVTSREYWNIMGMEIGDQFPWAKPNQKLVWGDEFELLDEWREWKRSL